MAEDTTPVDYSLFQYKGFNLISNVHQVPYLDTLENFGIRDSDVFAVTYPKSVFGSSWFDHIKEWYKHKEEFDFLYITYEEMVKDLRAAVVKISNFLGNQTDDRTIETIVDKCTFKNMRCNPSANYQMIPKVFLDHKKGEFMRKGKVGDWKNHFTVAQNERFDEVYQEKMKEIPRDFIWDIND
ncbi:UNVERIFIED_CONTAM: hypothetical protein FKN15_022265 [Acipenser sinensis]